MNKIRTQFLALLAVLLMGTGTANAIIRVAGTDVTSSNARDVLGNGQFKYDSSTKTLTVTNANLSAPSDHAIYNTEEGLKIQFVGSNEFNAKYAAVCSSASCTLTGTGYLRANCERGIILAGNNSTVTVDGPVINFRCTQYTAFDNNSNNTLKIQGSSTKITSINEEGFSYDLYNLSLGSGKYITHPYNGRFSTSLHTLVNSNGTAYKGRVLISSTPTEEETWYGLYIGETRVTNYNYEDINGDDMFVYRPASKTLDVRSGSFTNTGSLGNGIDNRQIDGLTIHITGSNVNITARNCPIYSEKSITITGPGTLNATSNDAEALMFGGADTKTCTITSNSGGYCPTLNFKAKTYAVYDYRANTTLDIRGTTTCVNFTPGSGRNTVNNLGGLKLGNEMWITDPIWGSYNESLKSITAYHAEEPYKGKITIGPSYRLYVGGTTVTPQNANNITGDGISGRVSYDESSKTLTLANATIKPTNFNAIQNDGVKDLKINVVGTNNLDINSNGGYQLLLVNQDMSIVGNGTLNLNTEINNYCSRVFGTCKLTIDGPTVNGSTPITCIDFMGSGKLEIKGTGTKVNFTPKADRPVFENLAEFTLGSGLFITKPVGGEYSSSVKSITTDGRTAYSGELVISSTQPGPMMYIGETRVTDDNASDILGDGTFSYNKALKTLTVRNAKMTNTGSLGSCISNREIDGLTIQFFGDNELNARMDAISSNKAVKITGLGKVVASSIEGYALSLPKDATCTVDGIQLFLTGNRYSPVYDYNGSSTLIVQGSNTLIEMRPANGSKPIHNLSKLELGDGISFIEPQGGKFSETLKAITVDGSTAYTGKAVIGSRVDYGVIIGETVVSSLNCNDVLGNGQFKYDHATRTLTMKNANLDNTVVGPSEAGANQGTGISNWSNNGLTLVVEGDNVIKARNAIIASQDNLNITGSGTLTGEATESEAFEMWGQKTVTVNVNGPTLNLTGKTQGLNGHNVGILNVDGTDTKITLHSGRESSTIQHLDGLTLGRGLYITKPAEGEFSESVKGITTDGKNLYGGDVVISSSRPILMYVGETELTRANANDILGDGQFKYDFDTKTLTVNNANLDNRGSLGSGISNRGIEGLTIRLIGENRFYCRMAAISSDCDVTITGTGTLRATSIEAYALFLSSNNTTCTIEGPTITFNGALWGLRDYYGTCTLDVKGSSTNLTFNGMGLGSYGIYNLGNLVLSDGVYIMKPENGRFSQSLKAITVDGTTAYTGEVKIGTPTDYGFFVGEKVVTSLNASDINGDGQFSYNPETNTLTVNNATLVNTDVSSATPGSPHRGNAIENWKNEGLTVEFVGDNTFTTRMAAICTNGNTTYVTGSGTLTATSTESAPLWLGGRGADMTISGPKLYLKGTTYGVEGVYGGELTLDGSTTELVLEPGAGYEAVHDLGNLTVKRVTIVNPYGATFNSSLGSLTLDGRNAYKGKVEIKYNFGIYVAETLVSMGNYNDVLGDGAFKYDPATRTLTVTNAKLDNQGSLGSGISNREVDNLKINLVGTSTFNTRMACVNSRRSFSFTGTGTLNAKSTEAYALYLTGEDMACTVNGPTLRFTGTTYGLKSYKSSTTLSVMGEPSSITLATTGERDLPTIDNLGSLRLASGVSIVSPKNASFNPSLKSITTDGKTATQERIVIGTRTDYGMYIAETLVTKDNASDVLGDGQFSYDPDTKTLTVRNASLNNQGSLGSGISNREIEDLTINLIGDNYLYCRMAAINSNCSFTIKGTGSLRATSMEAYALYLMGDDMTCTIDCPVATFNGAKWGLRSYKSTTTLEVKGSTTNVAFTGMSLGAVAIEGLGHLTLGSGQEILIPQGANFSESAKTVTTADGKTASRVVIGKAEEYGIYIAETMVSSANSNDVLGDGAFSYNPTTKVLTVRNANLKNSGTLGSGISNREVDGLIVKFEGTSTFNTRMDIINSKKTVNIIGNGTLTGTSVEGYGLSLTGDGITCNISGPSLSFTSNYSRGYALSGYNGTEKVQVAGNSTMLTLKSPDNSPTVYNIAALTLDSVNIVTPRGASFSRSLKSITTDGQNSFTGEIVIGYKQDYGIYIAETMISSANYRDVLGDGQFSYDPGQRVLTVRNANLTNKGSLGSGISNREVEDLTIVLEGNNVIDARMAAVSSRYDCTLAGTGTLKATSSEAYALYLTGDDMTFTIDGPQVSFKGTTYGLKAYKPTAMLEVLGKNTVATFESGARYSTIYNLSELELDGDMRIVTPVGGWFSEMLKSITVNGESAYTGKIVIGPFEKYDLRIAETLVDTDNAGDVLGDGAYSYDPDTKTLTVRNAIMRNDGVQGSGISNLGIDGLNIKFEGTNTIDVRNNVIYANASTTVSGNGTLKGSSWGSRGIMIGSNCESFTIDGPTIDITSPGNAIEDYTKNATLRVMGEKTHITLQPSSSYYNAIANFYQFELGNGLYITEPANGWFSSDLGGITTDGTTLAKKVVISNNQPKPEDYGFYVAETRVTSANNSDVLGNGQFSYDPQTKTLTVRNANLDNQGGLGSGISNRDVDGLVINLVGNNKFNTRMANIDSYLPFSITGSGTLTGESNQYCNIYLWGEGGKEFTCNINGPKLDFTGNSNVIKDYRGTATVNISGTGTSLKMQPEAGATAIQNLNNLTMENGLYITKPYGGEFNSQLGTIIVGTYDAAGTYMETYKGLVLISGDEAQPEYFVAQTDTVDISYHATSDTTCEVGAQAGNETVTSDSQVTSLEIPEKVDEYFVTGVAAEAFEEYTYLVSLTLPSTIETIGFNAFSNCYNLFDVYMLCHNAPVLLDRFGMPTDDNGAFAGLPNSDAEANPINPWDARAIRNMITDDDNVAAATLHVPEGCIEEYNKAPWNQWFTNIVDDAASNEVQGDVNGDGVVNVADIGAVIDLMSSDEYSKAGDVNSDGVINVADIGAIIDIMAANARRLKMIYGE